MSTYDLLIFISTVIILSYVFDVFSSKTRLPAVVLLLLLGVGIKQAAIYFGVDVSNYERQMNLVLPFLGTLGLIFIVLEGSLELDIYDFRKWRNISK